MERYTYFEDGKWRLRVGDTEYSGPWVDRLAAYEDTGLEPKQVKALGTKMKQIYSGTAEDIILDMKLLADHMECEKYRALGTVEELTALVKARDEGLMLEMPCKPGTELFGHCDIRGANPISRGYFRPPHIPKLGVDAWLTRTEAEAALGGGGDG